MTMMPICPAGHELCIAQLTCWFDTMIIGLQFFVPDAELYSLNPNK